MTVNASISSTESKNRSYESTPVIKVLSVQSHDSRPTQSILMEEAAQEEKWTRQLSYCECAETSRPILWSVALSVYGCDDQPTKDSPMEGSCRRRIEVAFREDAERAKPYVSTVRGIHLSSVDEYATIGDSLTAAVSSNMAGRDLAGAGIWRAKFRRREFFLFPPLAPSREEADIIQICIHQALC